VLALAASTRERPREPRCAQKRIVERTSEMRHFDPFPPRLNGRCRIS
jgi:hypothetical protein